MMAQERNPMAQKNTMKHNGAEHKLDDTEKKFDG